MKGGLRSIEARFWRMLGVRWQHAPLESGSHLIGARFNRRDMPALYLSADHATAIAEHHQVGIRPGTLVGYDVRADGIADLTDPRVLAQWEIDPDILRCAWYDQISRGIEPSTWAIVDRLYDGGAIGVMVPSYRRAGGQNLVLWRWHDARARGEGAAVLPIDPHGELRL